MSVITHNAYGKISTAALAISKVASHTAMESYGIVEMASHSSKGLSKMEMHHLVKRNKGGKGITVTIAGNRISIDAYVVVKYGVSINAVAESLKEAIKYKVEAFSGMLVETVNVNVVGVKL